LFLFTSALGRVWCGYACPQTVWTDLFILTERWVEGDRNARVRLHNAPWDATKIKLRAQKWSIWLGIALATGGAWVFYFADAPTLLRDLVMGQAHAVAYTTMAILTATTFVFGGFFREQICIYACPWPRIQAAMMDEETITIGYREWRGEPRGKQDVEGNGDCIDCMACVNVCPMGIDIRNGQQMECITCGLCIDACDDVMARIGKPRGLVDYFTLKDEEIERAGGTAKNIWHHVFRPRTLLYTGLWSLVGVGLVFALFIRSDLEMSVSPIRNPIFITQSDGTIRNIYELRIRNKHGEARDFSLTITPDDVLSVQIEGVEGNVMTVPADTMENFRVYVNAPPGSAPAQASRTEFWFWIEDQASGTRVHNDAHFNGTGG
ncbi:MAG: cytochrome c oxidase accessory protein CcoG, partial [Rubellimicrobium sp.]|nr:cytochrome c oxidase accessory protein CcoG [Rubellimicrobium sp.]